MRILIFSWRGPGHPNAGGAEISTHEHAKGWIKAGHRVTLFNSYYQGAKRKEQIDGVTIIREGRQFLGVQWEAFKWYLFKEHPKFDLVIDQFHGIPFFTPLYVKEKKLAFIHEVTKEVWKLNSWPWPFNLIPASVGMLFEPLIFKLLYKKIPFMTVSESTKIDLILWGIPKEHIFIIHNGSYVPKIQNLPPKEKTKTLIFLGVLNKDKGIEEALKIFSILLNNKIKDYQFWVVGKVGSDYLRSLKSQALRLKLNKKVIFWGFVNEKKKYDLLSRSHLLINPSIREGWGMVVIEAASVGTPTAAFNVSGLRDSIINGKTGILSKVHSVESLAKEIVKLLENEKRYNKLSQNAIIWSRNFSWDRATTLSTDLLKKVAS